MQRLAGIAVALIILTGAASAVDASNWDMNVLSEPYSFTNVSNTTQTVQVVNLTTNNGEPINESQLTDTSRVEYKYNGSTNDMEWLNNGYWYTEFDLNATGGEAEFEAQGETKSSQLSDSQGVEVNATRSFNISNLTVTLKNDFSGNYTAGEKVDFEVSLHNEWNDINVDGNDATVHVYFTNASWTSELHSLGYSNDLHQLSISLPKKPNSTYVVHVNATDNSDRYKNPQSSTSRTLETVPALHSRLEYMNVTNNACNNDSFFTECEEDANIVAGINITSSNAKAVNLSTMLQYRSNNTWFEWKEEELARESGLYTIEFEFPSVNKSKYHDTVQFKFNSSNNGRTSVKKRNITSRSYKIEDKSQPTASQGSRHKLKLFISQYFSADPLTSDYFENGTIDIYEPDNDVFTTINFSDMSYSASTDLHTKNVDIPGDAENGTYEVETTLFNKYWEKKTKSSSFRVKDVQSTFNTSEEVDRDVDKTGIHTFNFSVTNKLSTENMIETDVTGDLENITTVNNGSNLNVSGDATEKFHVEFNLSYVEDLDGELLLMDKDVDFNQTIDLELDAPECDLRNGTLCLGEQDKWVNITGTEKGHIAKATELMYLGDKNTSESVSVTVSGNLSNKLAPEPSVFDINHTEEIVLNYTVDTPGTYWGKVEINGENDTLQFWSKLVSDVQGTDTGISMPGEISIGDIQSGESATREVDIENTGDLEITELYVSSDQYTVSMDSTSIGVGNTETREITIEEIEEAGGSITVTGTTSGGNVTATADVTGNVIPDYSSKAEELRSQINELQAQATDSSVQTQLNDLTLQLSEIKTAYQQENYDEAESTFNSVQSTVNQLETQVGQGSTGTDPGTGTEDPGTGEQNNSGGGSPLLPLAAGLIMVLLIGFVAYTSLIPEEGDPLYDLLGK